MTRKPCPSDASDEEWNFAALYLALLDEHAPQRRYSLREVFIALRWLGRAGNLPEAKKGFVLLPWRWVVERSFGGLARFRRLSRDFERLPEVLAGLHFVVFSTLMQPKVAVLASGTTS